MQTIIKSLSNDSSTDIINLILPIQQKEFNVPITLDDQPDLLRIEQVYQLNGGGFWGAFVNDELVGTIALLKFDPHAAAIRKMFVKKEYRGKSWGIAQQLLENLVHYCKTNHITDIYLGTVSILEAALRFYEKNGFLPIEKNQLPENFPLMAPDNVFRHLHLSQ